MSLSFVIAYSRQLGLGWVFLRFPQTRNRPHQCQRAPKQPNYLTKCCPIAGNALIIHVGNWAT